MAERKSNNVFGDRTPAQRQEQMRRDLEPIVLGIVVDAIRESPDVRRAVVDTLKELMRDDGDLQQSLADAVADAPQPPTPEFG